MSEIKKRSKYRHPSPIQHVGCRFYLDTLIQNVEKSEKEKVEFIGQLRNILKLLQEGLSESAEDAVPFSSTILKSDKDADRFSSRIRDVWLDPCLVDALHETIKEEPLLVSEFFMFCNEDSTTERLAYMESDYRFKSSVMLVTPDTPSTTIIRTFLNILIGHWTDEGVLMEVDKKMGENHFGGHLKWNADLRARVGANGAKNVQLDELSFTMESISDIVTLEGLRKQLKNKHSEGQIEAIVDEVRNELVFLLDIKMDNLTCDAGHLDYYGGKAKIRIQGFEGHYGVFTMCAYQN